MPQAINVGDALFILAHLALLETKADFPLAIPLQAEAIIDAACLALSSGQFLDISYEKQAGLTSEDYWPMVSGKTAALLSACTQVGALLGGADENAQESYRCFGHYLGLAFQIQDDYLGIWGNSALTGKSTEYGYWLRAKNPCRCYMGWQRMDHLRSAGLKDASRLRK